MKTVHTLPLILLLCGACVSTPEVVPARSQVQLRQMQTRTYDTLDLQHTMRSVISTLQDLGFTVDEANPALGVVTGTRLDAYSMRMTVTVREMGEERIAVRANARIDEFPIDEAATYQDFFIALDKAMFLTANNVD